MSGEARVVPLRGATLKRLVNAVPLVQEQTGRPVVLIGGLAVLCRLPRPYRVTTDLDTVDRRAMDQHPVLDLLLEAGGTPHGPSGAVVETRYGGVQVDVIAITDADVEQLPDDPTHRLEVLSHAWAASSATELTLAADEIPPLAVRVAEPGALLAMKLQSVMNRPSAKESSDLLDIVRIALDPQCGPTAFTQLRGAESRLREDALLHARRWFDELAGRTLRRLHDLPEGAGLEIEDVRLVGDLLVGALEG